MHTTTKVLLLVLFVLVVCLSNHGVHAFGAGNIPSFAYMEGRAFRHGDIEDVLEEIKKSTGFAIGALIGKGKFGGLDIKRVYFGNWLRDYSQAVDIASLKKLQLQTIINLCMALGFLAHGYATAEFEVTEERLGVYLPVEHIDNPKGYGDGEDARKYHPKLRPPVNPQELEVDHRTGMKNYIANEAGSWDTSKAHVRRLLHKCIDTGRRARSGGGKDAEYESLRLLGTLLHTLEDFPAHSNFCELALVTMGHREVFVHVGDSVRIKAPNGRSVAPLVTGTFGGSDFIHSLLGEAGDHLSQASVSDLNKELENAKARSRGMDRSGPGGSTSPEDVLRDLLFKLPGGSGGEMARDMEGIERIRAGPAQGGKAPEEMSPQELYATMWQILSFRDSVVKKISATIEKIPGLGPLIEKLMDSISVFIFTTLEPYLKPVLKTATSGLMNASGEVIDTHDQYEVFNDPRASDPTHSFLSKDHFNLILNEPAGKIAKVIVMNTVPAIINAWDNTSVNVNQLTEEVLQCLFHPDFHDTSSKVQREMMQCLHEWAKGLGGKEREIIRRLSKQCVRNHENVRLAGEGGVPEAQGTQAYNAGLQAQQDIQGYLNNIPGVAQAQNLFGQFGGPQNNGPRRDIPGPTTGYNSGYGSGGGGGGGGPPAPGAPEPSHAPGHASSFFGDTSAPSSEHGGSSYPGGPPSMSPSYSGGPSYGAFPGSPPASSYGPPSGPPPGSPPAGMPSAGGFNTPGGSYNPSYAPSYNNPPPSFPGGPPRMPSVSGGFPGASHGFPPPGGPPPGGFASPFGGPPGGPPGFPEAGPPHQGQGHQHQHYGYGGPPPPPPGGFGGGW